MIDQQMPRAENHVGVTLISGAMRRKLCYCAPSPYRFILPLSEIWGTPHQLSCLYSVILINTQTQHVT